MLIINLQHSNATYNKLQYSLHPIGHNARATAIEGTEDTNEAGPRATLSPHPRSIHTLWQEYEFGIGGRKSVKHFTAAEQGKVKYNYHRRKVVWDTIAELV
jgi:hypothetical protein